MRKRAGPSSCILAHFAMPTLGWCANWVRTPASTALATGIKPKSLCRYLDRLDQERALPKTIVYNVNPADNYVLATAVGNFQDGSVAGKVQFGSAWWFLDQKEAMEWQLNALSNTGLLSRFVGMLTDSRSFMSFPRHEYFRRILCDMLGRDVERGELPMTTFRSSARMCFKNICFGMALRMPRRLSRPGARLTLLPARRDHQLCMVPSSLRFTGKYARWYGYFAASASSMSTPSPGASPGCISPFSKL